MISKLRLLNFQAFERFTMSFGDMAMLVGPNNVGKSTVIAALRTASMMMRHARRLGSERPMYYGSDRISPYPFTAGQFGLEEDNLRYEFREVETRFVVEFDADHALTAIWTAGELGGFFYLRQQGAVRRLTPSDVRLSYPIVGTVPVLAPLDRNEDLLNPKYVATSMSGRLTSRHFRNELRLLEGQSSQTHASELEAFFEFCQTWLPELVLHAPTLRGHELDVFYREVSGGNAKGDSLGRRWFTDICAVAPSHMATPRRQHDHP